MTTIWQDNQLGWIVVPVKHLTDGGDVAPQEDGDRPVAVGDHVVEEPPAGRGTAVELLGQQLDQLEIWGDWDCVSFLGFLLS